MSNSKTKGFEITSIEEETPILFRVVLNNKLFEVAIITPIGLVWVIEDDLNPFRSTLDLEVGMRVQLPVG